jgi:hypothetical protein
MTTYRVDAAEVAALGESLADLAEALALMGDPEPDLWALGPGSAGAALGELVGGWQLARLRTAEQLALLGEAAVSAGGLYLDTESGVRRSLTGGPR